MTAVPPHPVLDRLIAAYNAHDAAAFAAMLADDVIVAAYPDRVLQDGATQVRQHYEKVFADFPENRTVVVHRIVLGDRVIDHEKVRRHPDDPPIDVVAVNTVRGGRVTRIDFVSAVKVGE